MKKLLTAALLLLCLALPALAEVPYLQKVLRPDEMIFSGPSYDEFCVGTVREKGTFTIVEEVDDGEGHLWGRLKSGAGWIDLTHVRSEEVAAWPVSAAFAEDCPPPDAHRRFAAEESEYTVWIVLRAYEPLTDVRLVSLNMAAEEGFAIEETLCTLEALTPDAPLLAGVVFPGDMSACGLLFADEEGAQRLFALSISGRNGMLLLEELPLSAAPESPASPQP